MPYAANILLDSVNPAGYRLTTWELKYPRMVHAELMTHREFSRNAGSSRAIPVEKMILAVEQDPAMPVWWGKNQTGMVAREELGGAEREAAIQEWLLARDEAVKSARRLLERGVHKQIVNRIIEPWQFITTIVSATNFANWFYQRCASDAQPEIKFLADMMRLEYALSKPTHLEGGYYHMPLVPDYKTLVGEGWDIRWVSAGRCARVSYLTHHGTRDPQADVSLCESLIKNGHWSPLEHVAAAYVDGRRSGNFQGFAQLRKMFNHEHKSQYAA
jgi:thymidylate synthase ThyX